MSGSIPASFTVAVVPGVVTAGGNALDAIGVMLSTNVLTTAVTAYANAAAVSAVYGPTAEETVLANVYFAGYINSTRLPAKIWIAPVPATGAVAATVMNSLIAVTTDWVTFFQAYTDTYTNVEAYATWASAQNNRYAFIAMDVDASAATNSMASTALAKYVTTNSLGGIYPQWVPSGSEAAGQAQCAFVSGSVASIDFLRTNGKITENFKGGTGVTPTVYSATIAQNLVANGYNYYGVNANANNQWIYESPGQISGIFKFLDAYVSQIWLNSQFQTALMTLFTQVGAVPNNPVGDGMMEAACADPIAAALNFGAINTNVQLSAVQIAEVNYSAGKSIGLTLQNRGWYLQINPATAQQRVSRTRTATFWYTDAGAVHSVNLASIAVL